jgi:hypothetical protein
LGNYNFKLRLASASLFAQGNPKPEALNPEQYQRANIKTQNDKLKGKNLPYFCPLIFEFCFPEIVTRSLP